VTTTYRTDEYGLPTATTGTSSQPFAFTGEPRDATGLIYLRARYYDPALGRFMSRDTWPGGLAAPGTLDRYAYVGNNPATYADPSGLSPTSVVLGGKKPDLATFKAAMDECGRAIGRPITKRPRE